MAEKTTSTSLTHENLQIPGMPSTSILVERPGIPRPQQRLSISFQRTVRVSDNNEANDLPPGLGKFPIYRTADYEDMLPKQMAGKEGYFIPMYLREAMWIQLKSDEAFAIKIYVGGVNAVSGEPARETEVTMMRRLKLLQRKKSIQDYVVTPKQLWLDGIANADGTVRQFVAMPLGKGYTVEAQITGEEVIGGLQFEIVPSKFRAKVYRNEKVTPPGTEYIKIYVLDLHGKVFHLEVTMLHTVDEVKSLLQDATGISPDQMRLILTGQQMEDGRTLDEYKGKGMRPEVVLHLVLRLRGDGGDRPPAEMGIAAGGLIRQTIAKDKRNPNIWDPHCGTIFNVQILNSACFRAITGEIQPATPISAATYASYGYPYFRIFDEEPSGINGNFEEVKSIAEMDAEGKPTEETKEAVAEVLKSTNNEVVLLDDKGNRVGFRTLSQMEKAVRDRFGELTI